MRTFVAEQQKRLRTATTTSRGRTSCDWTSRDRQGAVPFRSVRSTAPLRSRLVASGRRYIRAFTLIELMVVIGIMALIVAIALPAATSLLESSRASQTLTTMQVLENAIDCYVRERPLQSDGSPLREGRNPEPLPDGKNHAYARVFGSCPPSPTVGFARYKAPLDDYIWPLTDEDADETKSKFLRLMRLYVGPCCRWKEPLAPNEDYASIECLLLFLTHFSSQARQIIDRLPDSAKTNLDKDVTFEDINNDKIWNRDDERAIELFEVVDAWKRPIRYSVKEPVVDPNAPGKTVFPAIWELRSAGPDGFFAAPWTDEDASDDVILRSQ